MKSSASNIGIINPDDPPRGGLGRALHEMIAVLQKKSNAVAIRKSRYGSWWIFSLQRWIDQNNIHTLLFPTGPGGLFLLRKPKHVRLIVLCYHTYWQQCRMVPGEWWKRVFVPWEYRTLRMADRVLCYSEDTRRVLTEEYGLEDVKLMKQIMNMHLMDDIPHGDPLPLTPSRREGEEIICLYVGRKDRRKGFDLMMEAWEKVKEKMPHAELRCLTNGDLSDQELHNHMGRAELVIVPSYLEGFGLVAAQAMMLGKTVLACDSDGLRSLIVHGQTGWLVPAGDNDALSDAWVTLLCNALLREHLGSQAAVFMREKFDRANAENELVVECSAA